MKKQVNTTFSGRVIVVTGGASGMGAACAKLFAEAGAKVFIIDRNAELAKATATDIGATALVGDISQSRFCDESIEKVAAAGRIDGLVNAAGIIVRSQGIDTSDDDWMRTLQVNVSGVFFMCRAALRHMKSQPVDAGHGRGAIVNFGSIWGELSGKGALAYAASKGAVHQLTRTFAIEHARDIIRVNAVCPGEVDTPMLRSAGRTVPLTDEQAREMGDRVVPMGRLAQPVEIAYMVRFLCSAEASYITGAMHYVDGGFSAV
jgi:NAD(P)-dependent dehydrogenase (short-subunit alcohol dehydrogenase family)